MTTTITIRTTEGDKEKTSVVNVGEQAQKHVLRTFNVTADEKVDVSKVLCAGLIQQMIELRDKISDESDPRIRATWKAIELVEQAQMQMVKANFVQA